MVTRSRSIVGLVLLVTALFPATALAQMSQEARHATGTVRTHDGAVPKSPVRVTVSVYDNSTCGDPTVHTYTAYTDAQGNFDVTWYPTWFMCDPPYYGYYFGGCASVNAWGSEVEPVNTFNCQSSWFYDPYTQTLGNPTDFQEDFVNAPFLISENGHWWARRVSATGQTTPLAIVDYEGFDPTDEMFSDFRLAILQCSIFDPGSPECDLSCLTQPNDDSCDFGSGSPKNLLYYLLGRGYTLWMVMSSNGNGAAGMRGSGDFTNGGAYQAMNLTKKILDHTRSIHGGRTRAALHGYSMGGPIIRAGLNHWCKSGTWDGTALGNKRLPKAECDAIRLWISGDGPLEGASGPMALQRYAMALPEIPQIVRDMILTPAAQEMLSHTVTPGCNVYCADLGGCDSTESDYRAGCDSTQQAFNAFQSWAKGTGYAYPTYQSGAKIPGIAYSQGLAPGGRAGTLFQEFITIAVSGPPADHHMKFNTSYGSETNGCGECASGKEWRNGSVNNTLYKYVHTYHTPGGWFGGLMGAADVSINIIPPYILTDSALDWTSTREQWWDYSTNTVNGYHAGKIHSGAVRTMAAWLHEHHSHPKSHRTGIENKTKTHYK